MVFQIRQLWIDKDPKLKQEWERLLFCAGIRGDENLDYTVGVYEGETLVATGSLYHNIIKCIAVDGDYQGGKVISMLISHLVSEVLTAGFDSCFVYTKPEAEESFLNLGFKEIKRMDDLVFLEQSTRGFPAYLEEKRKQRQRRGTTSAIVMNANPFTNGHLYLAEYAAERSDVVHLFVLSEDLSVFPKEVRLALVKNGTKHLKNVFIHETGDYIVSAKTFPSYFLPEPDESTLVQAKLDAAIFLDIAEALDITTRYVGEEPYSKTTELYNQGMKEIFNDHIRLEIIPRKEIAGEAISASQVRKLLRENKLEEANALVPPSTYSFLQSKEGQEIQKKLMNQEESRHG